MKFWFWSQNSVYEKVSYPDILRRGELQPRGDEREEEEKEQRHISFRTISDSSIGMGTEETSNEPIKKVCNLLEFALFEIRIRHYIEANSSTF